MMRYGRIRELREDKDLTQVFMANLLHVNQKTYSRYELGDHEIPLSALCTLADFHKVSIDYLLNRTDTTKPYPKSTKKLS